LLLVSFLLVNAPNYHLSLVVASVIQGDAVNCNIWLAVSFREIFLPCYMAFKALRWFGLAYSKRD